MEMRVLEISLKIDIRKMIFLKLKETSIPLFLRLFIRNNLA